VIVEILAALVVGLLGGWFAHRRLSLNYRQRWLGAVKALEDKSLEGSGDPTADIAAQLGAVPQRTQIAGNHAVQMQAGGGVQIPYVHGKWALWEHDENGAMRYSAVRLGLDPIELGATQNYRRFSALHRRDRENAQQAVEEMNKR
jgi:hypothetical protein